MEKSKSYDILHKKLDNFLNSLYLGYNSDYVIKIHIQNRNNIINEVQFEPVENKIQTDEEIEEIENNEKINNSIKCNDRDIESQSDSINQINIESINNNYLSKRYNENSNLKRKRNNNQTVESEIKKVNQNNEMLEKYESMNQFDILGLVKDETNKEEKCSVLNGNVGNVLEGELFEQMEGEGSESVSQNSEEVGPISILKKPKEIDLIDDEEELTFEKSHKEQVCTNLLYLIGIAKHFNKSTINTLPNHESLGTQFRRITNFSLIYPIQNYINLDIEYIIKKLYQNNEYNKILYLKAQNNSIPDIIKNIDNSILKNNQIDLQQKLKDKYFKQIKKIKAFRNQLKIEQNKFVQNNDLIRHHWRQSNFEVERLRLEKVLNSDQIIGNANIINIHRFQGFTINHFSNEHNNILIKFCHSNDVFDYNMEFKCDKQDQNNYTQKYNSKILKIVQTNLLRQNMINNYQEITDTLNKFQNKFSIEDESDVLMNIEEFLYIKLKIS